MIRRFRIKTRLLISFFIVILFTLIVEAIGYFSLTSIGDSAVKIVNNVRIMNDVYDHYEAVNAGIYTMLYVSDAAIVDYVVQKTKEHTEAVATQMERYLEIQDQFSDIFTAGEMQDMSTIFEVYKDTYIPVANEIFDLMEQDRREEAISVSVNRLAPTYNTIMYTVNFAFLRNLEYSEIITAKNSNNAALYKFLMMVFALLALVVSIILVYAVTKSISVPLLRLENAADRVARGYTDVHFEQTRSNDEITHLSKRLSEMMNRLAQVQQLKLDAIEAKFDLVEAREEKEKAENLARAKSNFLANMSHEIRTPMNAITGMAELLLRGELSDEARSQTQDIKRAGNNLISIINDILDFSKIESGKLEIMPVNYFLSSLINDTVNIIRMRLMEKPIKFYTHIGDNIPDNLIGDEVRLRQIFLNLLSNAVKYSEKGHIDLSISAEKKTDGQIWLKAIVSDTGFGIKPEDLGKLFGDFAQIDTKKNRGIEGTGLGLAITKRLCLAMSGEISVKSEYGKGSEFTVIIPQGIKAETPFVSASLSGRAGNLNDASLSFSAVKFTYPQARILIVDDIATNLKVAEGLLAPYKAAIDTSLSGANAIELVKQHEYDIIFMDHMMPEMDGIETTAAIRALEGERFKSMPIVALTANAISGTREMFLEKSFSDFLSKPIDISKLDEMLKRWMPKEKQNAKTGKESKKMENEKKLIILVDDNPTNLKIGKNVLSEKYIVATAPSAEKMFGLLQKNSPSMILLDIDMPEMNGYEAIKLLKSKPETKNIPVIFLTAKSDSDDELEGLSLGAIDYITKPFQPPLLLKRIEAHLLVEDQRKTLEKQATELKNFNDNLQEMVEEKTQNVLELQDALLKTMAEMVECRDDITGGHIERTKRGVKILLDEIERSGLFQEETKGWDKKLLLQSCQLHDVGKVSIADSILKKPGKLTDEEFKEMQNHTTFGGQIIEKIESLARKSDFLKYAKVFAVSHHEKWNGKGYPSGLKENEIPLIGRIMAIADVYDALTSVRPYKKAFTHEEAVRIINEGSGTQFDPALVEVFNRVADDFVIKPQSSPQ